MVELGAGSDVGPLVGGLHSGSAGVAAGGVQALRDFQQSARQKIDRLLVGIQQRFHFFVQLGVGAAGVADESGRAAPKAAGKAK